MYSKTNIEGLSKQVIKGKNFEMFGVRRTDIDCKNGKRESTVIPVFKEFCKERHAENKGKDYNRLQEIYANTEFFDLSFINLPETQALINQDKITMFDIFYGQYRTKIKVAGDNMFYYGKSEYLENIVLPFANNFIHYGNVNNVEVFVFAREYNPSVITGTLYLISEGIKSNMPFQIFPTEGQIRVEKKDIGYSNLMFKIPKEENEQFPLIYDLILDCMITICNLPTHSVVSDVIQYPKTEYFPRKQGLPAIKRVQPPIYYVLDKKEETKQNRVHCIKPRGQLEFSHSFNVRSHWRRINENSLGKDRNGEYKIKGLTFVNGYVKGSGELVRRLRVVK